MQSLTMKNRFIKSCIHVQRRLIERWMMADANTISKCTVNVLVLDGKVWVRDSFLPSVVRQEPMLSWFRFKLFPGSWWVVIRTIQIRCRLSLVSRKILNGQQRTILRPTDTPVGNNVSVRPNVSIERSSSELFMAWWQLLPWLGFVRNYSVTWNMPLSTRIEINIPLVNMHTTSAIGRPTVSRALLWFDSDSILLWSSKVLGGWCSSMHIATTQQSQRTIWWSIAINSAKWYVSHRSSLSFLYTVSLLRFKSIPTYPIVLLVPVPLPMGNGVPMSVNIFVVHWSAWSIIVRSAGIWILIIMLVKWTSVNLRRWFTNHWCVMLASHENEEGEEEAEEDSFRRSSDTGEHLRCFQRF